MKTKTERTFDLTQSDIRAAIIAYVNAHYQVEAKDADLHLKIDGGYVGRGQFDDDRPASVQAQVIVKVG
jgi:hypothetical protein